MKRIIVLALCAYLCLAGCVVPSMAEQESAVSPGTVVSFGSYNMEEADSLSPIQWIVLSVSDDMVLMISLYALDSHQFFSGEEVLFGEADWEHSYVRLWLNRDFRDKAFSAEEKEALLTLTVQNEGGNATSDRVFLLSDSEATGIFKELRCEPTAYMKKAGDLGEEETCDWWTRSIGPMPGLVRFFDSDGELGITDGIRTDIGARPVIAVDPAWFG